MIVKLKCKILINGLFPIKNFQIDEFRQKTGKYNKDVEKKILSLGNDTPIYMSGDLLSASYSIEGESDIFYEYLENDDFIDMDIGAETFEDITTVQNIVIENMSEKVTMLAKRLRLITNLPIGLPITVIRIFDKDSNYINRVAFNTSLNSNLFIGDYTEDKKQLLTRRLRLRIPENTINDIEKNNNRYKRAMDFYDSSFCVADTGTKFTLLFSSLEALFNIKKRNISDTVAKYSNIIMKIGDNDDIDYYTLIKKLYNIRSAYIHGNEPIEITEDIEFGLREIVRRVLIVYWFISLDKSIKSSSDMLKFLDENKDYGSIVLQLFVQTLYTEDIMRLCRSV